MEKCYDAVFADMLSGVKYLIEYKGVPLDSIEEGTGETFLHTATYSRNSYNTVKYLLSKGISTSIRDDRGKTALDAAKSSYNNIMVQVLSGYMSQNKD